MNPVNTLTPYVRTILILSTHIHLIFQMPCSSQIFWLKFCINFSSPSCALHVLTSISDNNNSDNTNNGNNNADWLPVILKPWAPWFTINWKLMLVALFHTHAGKLCTHHTCHKLWILAPMCCSEDKRFYHWYTEDAGLLFPGQDIKFQHHLQLLWPL
jgi:hypothetical protein